MVIIEVQILERFLVLATLGRATFIIIIIGSIRRRK
jgi:hypothetical protein